jgi:exosortase E/protease (VPEID-CTERM system)
MVVAPRRWVASVAILVSELLLLSLVGNLEPASHTWSSVALLRAALPWLLCCALATVLLVPWTALAHLEPPRHPGRAWTAHAVAFAALGGLTTLMGTSTNPVPGLGLAFVGTTGLVVLTAFAAAGSLRSLAHRLGSVRGRLALGVATGSLAYGAALTTMHRWHEMAGVTLHGAAALLRTVAGPVQVEPESHQLGLGDFVVQVDAACSGLEGLGLTAVLVTAYLLWFARSRWDWVALPAALLAVFVANLFRIAALVWIGHHVSPDVAVGGFHSKAGWVLFAAIALVVLWALRSGDTGVRSTTNPARPYLMPVLVVVAASMVGGLVEVEFPRAYPLVAVAGLVALGTVGRPALRFRGLPSGWAVVAGAAAYGLWMAAIPASDPTATLARRAEYDQWPTWLQAGWVVARILGGVIVAPMVEELAFRGYLLRRLVQEDFENVDPRVFRAVPMLVSSLAFGLVHSTPVAGTLAGLVYAWAYARRGRLEDAMFAHAVTNAVLAAQVLGLGSWALWIG